MNLPLLCRLGVFSTERQWRLDRLAFGRSSFGFGRLGSLSYHFVGSGGKLLVSIKNIVVSKDSIGIDKDLTKDENLNTFKMYCKRRKSSVRFPDRKARNRFLAQTKGRREKERERKGKGKKEEGKEKRKGEREREIGSEALAETEKIANAPAGNQTRNPSKRG